MSARGRSPRGRSQGTEKVCDDCLEMEALAARISAIREESRAEETPDDFRAEAVELFNRADGLEAGTIARFRPE